MKKLIALVLILCVAFSLCACVSEKDVEAARQEGYDAGYAEAQETYKALLDSAQEAADEAEAEASAAYDEGYADGVVAVEQQIADITDEDSDWISDNLAPNTDSEAIWFIYGWNSAVDGIYYNLDDWTADDTPTSMTYDGEYYSIYNDGVTFNDPAE